MRLGDFFVPANLTVILDFVRRYGQLFSQPLLKVGKPCFALRCNASQSVNFLVNTGSQQPAVPESQGWVVIQGVVNHRSHLMQLVKAFAEMHKERVLAIVTPLDKGRHALKRMGSGDQISRIASLISELCGEALHVSDTLQ